MSDNKQVEALVRRLRAAARRSASDYKRRDEWIAAATITDLVAALNTRPAEADMRERCALHLEERGTLLANTSTNTSIGAMMKGIFDAEATALRQLPLSNEGESS